MNVFPFLLGLYECCRNGHLQWLPDSRWKQCQYISSQLEPFSLLCKSLLSNVSQWNAFKNSKAVYFLMSVTFSSENASLEESKPLPEASKRAFSVLIYFDDILVCSL